MRPYLASMRAAGVKSLTVQVRLTVLRAGDKRATSKTRVVSFKLGKK